MWVKGLFVVDFEVRGWRGEVGEVGRLRVGAGGVVEMSEILLCSPFGRDRVEVDMEVERERYE